MKNKYGADPESDRFIDPQEAGFWWTVHERFPVEGYIPSRNPSDIDTALRMEPGHHALWLDAWESAIKMEEFGVQTVVQAFTNKYIARLLDAGILVWSGDVQE